MMQSLCRFFSLQVTGERCKQEVPALPRSKARADPASNSQMPRLGQKSALLLGSLEQIHCLMCRVVQSPPRQPSTRGLGTIREILGKWEDLHTCSNLSAGHACPQGLAAFHMLFLRALPFTQGRARSPAAEEGEDVSY